MTTCKRKQTIMISVWNTVILACDIFKFARTLKLNTDLYIAGG